jgi:hypothetical protein
MGPAGDWIAASTSLVAAAAVRLSVWTETLTTSGWGWLVTAAE